MELSPNTSSPPNATSDANRDKPGLHSWAGWYPAWFASPLPRTGWACWISRPGSPARFRSDSKPHARDRTTRLAEGVHADGICWDQSEVLRQFGHLSQAKPSWNSPKKIGSAARGIGRRLSLTGSSSHANPG